MRGTRTIFVYLSLFKDNLSFYDKLSMDIPFDSWMGTLTMDRTFSCGWVYPSLARIIFFDSVIAIYPLRRFC